MLTLVLKVIYDFLDCSVKKPKAKAISQTLFDPNKIVLEGAKLDKNDPVWRQIITNHSLQEIVEEATKTTERQKSTYSKCYFEAKLNWTCGKCESFPIAKLYEDMIECKGEIIFW